MTVRTETMAASRTGAAVSALNMDVKRRYAMVGVWNRRLN